MVAKTGSYRSANQSNSLVILLQGSGHCERALSLWTVNVCVFVQMGWHQGLMQLDHGEVFLIRASLLWVPEVVQSSRPGRLVLSLSLPDHRSYCGSHMQYKWKPFCTVFLRGPVPWNDDAPDIIVLDNEVDFDPGFGSDHSSLSHFF